MKTLGFALGLSGWLSTAPLYAQLTLDPKVIDFGEQGHNQSVVQTLTLTNSGQKTVTLSDVRPTCSCIRVEDPIPGKSIPPGSSVTIRVTMSSGRALGKLEKHIEISTVEAEGLALSVAVRMSVFEGLSLEPFDLKFDGVVGGPPVVQFVDIQKRGAAAANPTPLRVEKPEVFSAAPGSLHKASPYFSARSIEIPGGQRIEVTLLPTHPEGRIWGNLEMTVGGKPFVVPVVGEMFRHIKVVPTYFNFNRVESSDVKSFEKSSVLTATDGKPFKILSVTPTFTQRPFESCAIAIEDKSSRDGAAAAEHVLSAKISTGDKSGHGSFSGKVVVKTDHPQKPELLLSFFGFFP